MIKYRFLSIFAGLGIAAACVVPTNANAAPVMDMSDIIGSAAMGSAIEYAADQKNYETQPQKKSQQYRPQPQTVPSGDFTYKISMQRRRANYDSFIQKSMATNPVAGEEMRGALSGRDVIAMASPVLQNKFGLRINNVSDAYAFWMILAWQAANNQNFELTKSHFDGVKAQVAQSMGNIDGVRTANDEVKQDMAESLWTYGIMINEVLEQIKSDPAKQKQLARSVMANTKSEMSVDLSTLTLTDQGFVPRKSGKRGDAGEAMEGAEPGQQGAGQMASAAPSPSSGGMDGADIALLIAAVSAGAGGIFMIGKGISNQRQG
jgi:hypothetical protein